MFGKPVVGRSPRAVFGSACSSRRTNCFCALLLVACSMAAPVTVRAAGHLGELPGPAGVHRDSSRTEQAHQPSVGMFGRRHDPAPPSANLGGTWHQIAGPFDTPNVNRGSLVRDSRRHRALLVDGEDFEVLSSLSLPATGSPQWSEQSVAGPRPAARVAFVAVYDSLRDRIVMHGGWDGARVRSDTWALDLDGAPRWSELLPDAAESPARDGHVAILDPVRDRLLIFGGTVANCSGCRAGDTWALSLDGVPQWSLIAASGTGPSPRTDASAVYDPWLDLLVVFGGWNPGESSTTSDETWILRLSDATWTRFATERRPAGRMGQVAIADLGHQRMVIQGGGTSDDLHFALGDAWSIALRGVAAWEPMATSGPASAGCYHGAVYSPERHSMIAYGGLAYTTALNSCYELNLDTGVWVRISPTDAPLAPERQAGSWVMVDPVGPQAVVLDGGDTDFRCYDEPWSFALSAVGGWKHSAAPGVVPRCGASCTVYDSKRDRVMSFGGGDVQSRGGLVNEISVLPLHSPGAGWQSLPVAGPLPIGRFAMSLVYDARRDRILMFGGATWGRVTDDSPFSSDELWQLSLGDTLRWSRLATIGTPGERWQATAMIDTLRDRLVIHGGIFSNAFHTGFYPRFLYDTWTLPLAADSPVWQRLGPDAPALTRSVFDYIAIQRTPLLDFARDRLLLVDTSLPAAYSLSFEQPTEWKPLAVERNVFATRTDAAQALDAAGDRVLVFGGVSRGLLRADLNAFQLLPPTHQIAIETVLERGARDGRNRFVRIILRSGPTFSVDSLVRWGATLNGAPVHFDESFSAHSGPNGPDRGLHRDLVGRVMLGELEPLPADSVVAFRAFSRHGTSITGYTRLPAGSRTAGESGLLTNEHADTAAPATGLRVLGGAASGSVLTLEYALPSASPATIDLLDVQGRRVARREAGVGTDGRGKCVVQEARDLSPGLYLVRLAQGTSVFTTRVVVLR